MPVSSGAVTVNVTLFEWIPERLAVMMVVPSFTVVTSPFAPDVLLIVAIPVFDEFHVTDEVISNVVSSEKVPVAVNCWVLPRATSGLAGVIIIDVNSAAVTVKVPEGDVCRSYVAVIKDSPTAMPVVSPLDPESLLIDATLAFDEVQVAYDVRFCVSPLSSEPVAVNC
jgi:hypothetical protein